MFPQAQQSFSIHESDTEIILVWATAQAVTNGMTVKYAVPIHWKEGHWEARAGRWSLEGNENGTRGEPDWRKDLEEEEWKKLKAGNWTIPGQK